MADPNKIIDIRGRLGASAVLNELAVIFKQGNREIREADAVLRRGIGDFGEGELVDELCRRLATLTPDDEATSVIWALEEIGGDRAVEGLREVLRTLSLPSRIRTEAALVLHALGEKVDPSALPAPRPEDFQAMLVALEQQVDQSESGERAFILNSLLDQVCGFIGQHNHTDMLNVFVDALKDQDKPVAADMMWVLREFGPAEEIRTRAGKVLGKMEQRGLEPNRAMVESTFGGRFSGAYVSDLAEEQPQKQLFVAWEQPSGALLLLSFLIDNAFWGGAIKDFFVRPGLVLEDFSSMLEKSNRYGVSMSEADRPTALRVISEALTANRKSCRPLPLDYRRYHRLVEMTLFEGSCPVAPPPFEDEMRSPLPGRPGQVENLLMEKMPRAEYQFEQVRNGRMLWRDYHATLEPSIRKPEVWAASVDYIIGQLEGREEQTQQAVADRYGVSVGSVSKRYGEIWDDFLDVEQGAIAYTTDKEMPDPMADLFEMIGEMLEENAGQDELDEEDLEADYLDYLETHDLVGPGANRLEREAFVALMIELYTLLEIQEVGDLDASQVDRLIEIRALLLLDKRL